VRNESNFDTGLSEAIEHLRAALAILDSTQAPAQIGAHVDLALCQLQDLNAANGPIEIVPPPGATEH